MSGNTRLICARAVLKGIGADGSPEIVDDGAILVRDGVVADVGPADALRERHPDIPVEGGPGLVAIPALVNAHHHTGLTPLQLGMPFAPLELWLPHFLGVRAVDPRLDTLYSAVEMLESGTVTVQHIQGGVFGDPDGWHREADAILGAYRDIGMRASYSFMIRDQNQLVYDDDEPFLSTLPAELAEHFRPRLAAGRVPVREMIGFFADLRRRWAAIEPDRIRVQLAPANLHWCSDACLEAVFGAAREHGVKLHMHLAETKLQEAEARARTGGSAVRHLARLGCLGPDVTLGHAIWCNAGDLDLLGETGTCVCHNASSGLRLASGIAPVNAMRQRGIAVALGIDQCGINDDRDMLQEMRVAWLLQREPGLFQDRLSSADLVRMATEHGARTTGFEGEIGRIETGKAADIVLLDWSRMAGPWLDPRTALTDLVLQRARPGAVERVYVAGAVVVDGGRVVTIDRDALHAEIAAQFERGASAAEAEARLMTDRLLPHIEAYYRRRGERRTEPRYMYNGFNG